jgi:hypothetical protein
MSDDAFLTDAIHEFERHQQLADRAIAQLGTERFFTALAGGDNSVAVIVKHVSGNLRSRWTDFLTTDGEKPDRHRDAEFDLRPDDSRERLLADWTAGWAILFATLRGLHGVDLGQSVRIRGEPLTARQAITRQLTHYAYHVGQIVYLAKHLVGDEWQSLSIPRGRSSEFNREPAKYLPPR